MVTLESFKCLYFNLLIIFLIFYYSKSMKKLSEKEQLLEFIKNKEKMVAMLAPSFLIDFSYPEIIGKLKRLGFDYVVEVSAGAIETNKQLKSLLKLNPNKRYISNACPGIVQLIKSKYPKLTDFLAPIDTPMMAIARIVQKKYPNHKKVFIGPCLMKKIESQENPELEILVLTFKEISEVFKIKKIVEEKQDNSCSFDITGLETRLYPISGGLAQSSGIVKALTDPEWDVISGKDLVEKNLQEFPNNTEIKILDALFCDGGCINGPGIISKDSLDNRRKKVINHWMNK